MKAVKIKRKRGMRSHKWLPVVLALAILILLFSSIIGILVEYQWQKSVHFAEVYVTRIATSIGIEIVGFLIYAVVLYGLFAFVRRNLTKSGNHVFGNPMFATLYRIISIVVPILIAFIGGKSLSAIGWREALLFFDHASFGTTDPVFGHDISFYVFEVPVFEIMLHAFMALVFILGVLAPVLYLVFAPIKSEILHDTRARRHVALIWAFFLVLWGMGYYFNRFDLLYDDTGSVYGAGYTQIHVTLPYYTVAMAVSFIGAILLFIGVLRSKLKIALSGPVALFALMILGGIAQLWVQKISVAGNEVAYETPYLARNIDATRKAFGIDAGHLKIEQMDPTGTITAQDIQQNDATIKNIRVNDVREIQDVFNQIQGLKPYYHFGDIDVDRYNGQEVYIGTRQMQTDKLPARAQTWLNQTLVYTHGYGVVASPVNSVTADGLPNLVAHDMPQAGTFGVSHPQLYFDESDASPVVVHAKTPEFDYPSGDTDVTNRYDGKDGISLGGFNRFMLAWEQGSLKLLTSSQISSESKILLHRNIYDRLESIAPFLTFEQDGYIVKRDNGHLVWIVDAYTTTSRYPYSEGVSFEDQTVNYIRNSVKAVVDANDGTVNLYLVDPKDPIAASYAKIFPNLFTKQIPSDIQAHFRYPESLFTIQANTLLAYHVDNAQSFYNRDDVWAVANEIFSGKPIAIPPFYQTMKLPGEDKGEFVLSLPLTPQRKDNLVAWMVARNDGANYGQLILYEFPRGKLVYGPLQIESRIDQEPSISQQLTLWNQQGSHVIRGNLLPIFLGSGMMYIEPVYIQADRAGALPQVKRVIVVYQDSAIMANSIGDAFNQLFHTGSESSNANTNGNGTQSPSSTGQNTQNTGQQGQAAGNQKDLAEQAYTIMQQYQQATANGDFATAGKALQQLQTVLKQLKDAASK
jgi:uncharacterized membrane protein (UPF0182 family)